MPGAWKLHKSSTLIPLYTRNYSFLKISSYFSIYRSQAEHKNNIDGKNNQDNNEKKKPHIKKPLNAFMLYMKEMRAKVVAECTLKESAAINQILGRRVRVFYKIYLMCMSRQKLWTIIRYEARNRLPTRNFYDSAHWNSVAALIYYSINRWSIKMCFYLKWNF